jgi:hypothetical protein
VTLRRGHRTRRLLRLAALVAALTTPARPGQEAPAGERPCESQPAARGFDFWLGTWDVVDAKGQPAGTNTIRKAAGGCALHESWTSARGPYVGESLNYYDVVAGRWVQVWVDSTGAVIQIAGRLEAGAMKLTGERVQRDGTRTAFRGTWTRLEGGRVRQLFEESADGEKSWQVWFDGYYTRRP